MLALTAISSAAPVKSVTPL